MRSQHTLELLSLMLIIQAGGCSWILQRITPDRREYRSFSLRVGNGQKQEVELMGKALWESIKDKLTQKGYIYKEATEQAEMKGVIQYKTILKKNKYFQIDVKFDIYDNLSSQKIWSAAASNTVRYRDIIADLIQPIARQLTLKFPYASHLGGIGVIIGRDLAIKSFSRNSPAREAGLQVNDVILKVDNREINGLKECQNMLKGEVNTQVELTIKREEQELNFIVSRISLNQMMKGVVLIDEAARKRLKQDFRKEVLQQP